MLEMMLSTSSLLSVSAEESLGGNDVSMQSEGTEEPISYSKTIEFGSVNSGCFVQNRGCMNLKHSVKCM